MQGLVDQIAQEHLTRIQIKEDFVAAACPFHKGGQESHPSFWINRENGYWGCFACEARGSGLKWLLKELGVGSVSIDSQLDEAERQAKKTEGIRKLREKVKNRRSFKGDFILPDALLGVFDFLPLDLVDQGFTKETLRSHDVGFDKRNDRITFPIRDLFGNLIGISGRATMVGDEPKYLVYNGRRMIDGKEVKGELGAWYPGYSNDGVRNHLWGLDKCYQDLFDASDSQIIIVEGYKAALWLRQLGWTETVALMGARMSATQERIVRSLGADVFVLLDNNYAGLEGAKGICQRLALGSSKVYRCRYPSHRDEDTQPDDLEDEELEEVLCTAQRVGSKRGRENVRRKRIRRMGRKHRGRQRFKPPKVR